MIIGYDFWADGVYYDSESTEIIVADNDGVAFDTCNTLVSVNDFTLKNGTFDEFYVSNIAYANDGNSDTNDVGVIDNAEKPTWSSDTILLAKFQGNLIAGTIGIDGEQIDKLEIRRRKKGSNEWQTYFTIDYSDDISLYTVIDKFIESEETYEYCIRPIAGDIIGNNSVPYETYISYDHANIFDNSASYDLVYDLKFGSVSKQIGANTIETLSSKYPFVVYGETDYAQGNIECLLVSEESAIGEIDLKAEKILRNNILTFLCNKQYKILKNSDGLYMLIKIVGTPTISPLNDIVGVYNLSFDYIEVGDADSAKALSSAAFEFNYINTIINDDAQGNEVITTNKGKKNIG